MNIYAIFESYDNLLTKVPTEFAWLVSLCVLAGIVWTLFHFIKGKFVYILGFLIFVPAVWPALKIIGNYGILIFQFLISRTGA